MVELNDQLLDPDAPTLASQDKLKVSCKGLPFVIYLSIYLSLSIHLSAPASRKNVLDAARSIHWTEDMVQVKFLLGGRSPMRICSQPRRHPHRNSSQIHGLELMSLSASHCPPKLFMMLMMHY